MEVLSLSEARRALELANMLCVRSDEGAAAVLDAGDLDLVAFILIMAAHASTQSAQAFAACGQDLAA